MAWQKHCHGKLGYYSILIFHLKTVFEWVICGFFLFHFVFSKPFRILYRPLCQLCHYSCPKETLYNVPKRLFFNRQGDDQQNGWEIEEALEYFRRPEIARSELHRAERNHSPRRAQSRQRVQLAWQLRQYLEGETSPCSHNLYPGLILYRKFTAGNLS